MLNLNLCEVADPAIKNLVMEFRRTQVSRFPIDVVATEGLPHVFSFIDSRFPLTSSSSATRKNSLAIIQKVGTDEKGRPELKITGRLITNDKYSSGSDDYYTRMTTDVKKMFKFMKDYIKPFSAMEIAQKTGGNPYYEFAEWKREPVNDFQRLVNSIDADTMAEELMRLHSLGVQFQSEKFRQVITTGLDLHAEGKRRKALPTSQVHVFVQPDESVMVTSLPDDDSTAGAWTFENMSVAPETVQQQVAMLRLTDKGTYVPEVGKKVSDRMFWVHVNPKDFNSSNT